jgi:hypothetical protein
LDATILSTVHSTLSAAASSLSHVEAKVFGGAIRISVDAPIFSSGAPAFWPAASFRLGAKTIRRRSPS